MRSIIEFGYQLPWSLILAGFVILSLTWVIGKFLSLFLSDEPAFDGHIGLGALVLSTLIAIAITKFKTVLAVVLPLILLLILVNRKKIPRIYSVFSHGYIKEIAVILGFFIFFFLLNAVILYKGPDDWAVSYIDNYSYITQINLMERMQIETHAGELIKPLYGIDLTLKPYHYFEMWLAVAGKLVSGQLGYLIYNLFLIPYLASILLFQNFRILYSKFNLPLFTAIIIPILIITTLRFVIMDDIIFNFFKNLGIDTDYSKFVFFQNYGFWHFLSYLFGVKLLISGIFFTPIVYYFVEKKPNLLWIYSGLLPLLSMVYIPFSLIISVIQKFRCIKVKNSYLLVLPMIILIWIKVFYVMNGKDDEFGNFKLSFSDTATYLIQKFKDPFSIFFDTITGFFSSYYWLFAPLFLFLLIAVSGKKSGKMLTIWFLMYPITGISFDILFKIYVIIGVFLFGLLFFANRHIFRNIEILTLVFVFVIFQLFDLTFPKFIESHQIFALTIPPLIYLSVVFFWGNILSRKNLSVLASGLILLFISTNLIAIYQENNRSFIQKPVDKTFLNQIFSRMAVKKKIRAVYCSKFTLMPFINYDRVGDELLHHTDDYSNTVFSIDLFTKEDTISALKNGSFSYFFNLPIAHFIRDNRNKSLSINEYRFLFLKLNKIDFVFRKDNYERSRLNFLNPYIVDSAFNHQMNYQVLKLRWD